MKLRNLLALGALAAGAAYLYQKYHTNAEEEVIGGADGPTTIHFDGQDSAEFAQDGPEQHADVE